MKSKRLIDVFINNYLQKYIKPCKYCGHKGLLSKYYKNAYYVACTGIKHHHTDVYSKRRLVIKEWNS